jgi:hypothetical protein
MDFRLILDCLVMALFCVAAGINLWNLMLREVHKRRVVLEAVVGLAVLLVWASSEARYLF